MQKPKKIPQRMCVACRQMQDKKDMFRVVRTANGEILPDKTGKLAGRGAYICAKSECIVKLRKMRLLNRTFSCEVPEEVYRAVEEALLADGGK